MKSLLAPEKRPNPEILANALGILASGSFLPSKMDFEKSKQVLYECLTTLVGNFTDKLITDDQQPNGARLCTLEMFAVNGNKSCKGNVTFALVAEPPALTATTILIQKAALTFDNFDKMVKALNQLWEKNNYDVMYAYDEDDMAFQNMDMPFAASQYGITENQYNIVRRGPVREIDTRGNPGYVSYEDGKPISLQWLNYWNAEIASRIVGNRRGLLAKIGKITDLKRSGGLQLRLAKKPWSFDDVEAHKKQLECRRVLGLLEQIGERGNKSETG